jgi:membrane protein implicated in regulation of membrane protease activity
MFSPFLILTYLREGSPGLVVEVWQRSENEESSRNEKNARRVGSRVVVVAIMVNRPGDVEEPEDVWLLKQ